MGIATRKWIVNVMLHDIYPGNEGTGLYLLAWCP